ncbi:MAG TPA: carboxypeptidase M32, partial [Limnochordia bacterium]
TYSLHVILRFNLERQLIEGTLDPKDLPDAWNQAMHDLLGVEVPNDAQGVLQDVHWSNGGIGYFPTYALGNLLAVQLFERACADLPDLMRDIEGGRLGGLREWLNTHVHAHGAKFTPAALIQRVTGEALRPEPYLRYIEAKYRELYGL